MRERVASIGGIIALIVLLVALLGIFVTLPEQMIVVFVLIGLLAVARVA